MIKVENLTKIYKSRKKEKCVALDNVSFTLEDSGFVFIIGKSGSGKTTLLSILGGLDDITSGNVSINGISLAESTNKTFVGYRNQTSGYIFQDFHLIDELTVEENIALSLQLQNQQDDGRIQQALHNVDLDAYGKRYPKELSGGEKQRIAIARALVKNPSVIFADEPTGNLDSQTTRQILSLLKELSKDRLVVIVSHNLVDAREYADRIIELSQGRIINDFVRNPNYCDDVKLEQGKLFLPVHKTLTEQENDFVNTSLSCGNVKRLVQVDNVFIPNNRPVAAVKPLPLPETRHVSFKNSLKLGARFLKKDSVRLCFYAVIVACLVAVLGLCELIATFNSSSLIEHELKSTNQNVLSLGKNQLADQSISTNTSCIFDISDDEIQTFYDNGYNGNIYKLVNLSFSYGSHAGLAHSHTITKFDPSDAFYNGTRGVLITTEEYLENLFGELQYIAVADKVEAGGVYITDYVADAMMYYSPTLFNSYKSVLGDNRSFGQNVYGYVNGIIKTNYKEKYAYYLNVFKDVTMTAERMEEIVATKEFQQYYDDVLMNLSVAYTTNENFVEDMVALNAKSWCPSGNSYFEYDGKKFEFSSSIYFENAQTRTDYNLGDNEIAMNYSTYNQIFNTNYTEETLDQFVPHEVTFKYSHFYDVKSANTVYSFKANIVRLTTGWKITLSDNLFKQALRHNTFTCGLYFDDVSDVSGVLDVAENNGLYANSVIALSLSSVTKAVSVFREFFYIILVGLCVCTFSLVASYGLN